MLMQLCSISNSICLRLDMLLHLSQKRDLPKARGLYFSSKPNVREVISKPNEREVISNLPQGKYIELSVAKHIDEYRNPVARIVLDKEKGESVLQVNTLSPHYRDEIT